MCLERFTYVMFDCNGFKEAGIKADVEFCPEYILPIDELGKIIPNTNYKLNIPQITMTNWMEFTWVLNAKPFVMAKYKDIKWTLTNMVIDTDSKKVATINDIPINITPPKGFEGSIDPNSANWKGFYVERLDVEFYRIANCYK
ncbi:MAG: hypothetical protein IPL08_14255 [Saprospiraceae bacterium]|nr:hypothetical protein [Saprospiraceae bacterium]